MKIQLLKSAPIFLAAIALLALPGAQADDKKEGHSHDAAKKDDTLVIPMSPIPRPEKAKVYIIAPKDGKTVGKKVTVRFGLKGMGVAPAGVYLGPDKPTGHHHLVIDSELPDLKLPFPMDEKRLHFGGGQTEVTLELEPGEHTLQLVLADHAHIPHDPPLVSEKVTFTVK